LAAKNTVGYTIVEILQLGKRAFTTPHVTIT